jgi:hypothetical protein
MRAAHISQAEHFTEALLHVLNEQHCPYDDEALLRQCLKAVCDMLEGRESVRLFYTNDLKALVDIIIRELSNLAPDDDIRCRYLDVTHSLLLNSHWVDTDRYRRDDLCAVLEGVMEAECDDGGGQGMLAEAREIVTAIFTDCVFLS